MTSHTTPRLSTRELQTLKLIAFGFTNKEIAGTLSLSVKTVEAHKANGMRKLGFASRRDIVRFAIMQDWYHELSEQSADQNPRELAGSA